VHRAKGLEADNIYVLKPHLMPFPKATKDWEVQQEKNILYVCLTRAKKKLAFVEGEAPVWYDPSDMAAEFGPLAEEELMEVIDEIRDGEESSNNGRDAD
jgi:superfamily I DNA/RNA helicase